MTMDMPDWTIRDYSKSRPHRALCARPFVVTPGFMPAMTDQIDQACSRTDRHSLRPDYCGREMDEADKVGGSPVITGCQASEVFELAKAALDAIALFVGIGVVRNDDLAGAV